jgi:hypothetical protein
MDRHGADVWSVPPGLSSLSLSGKRETTSPISQSKLFFLSYPTNNSSPILIFLGPFFLSCCWCRRPRHSSMKFSHKSSLSFCCYLNRLVILALSTRWKSGTATAVISCLKIPGWQGQVLWIFREL